MQSPTQTKTCIRSLQMGKGGSFFFFFVWGGGGYKEGTQKGHRHSGLRWKGRTGQALEMLADGKGAPFHLGCACSFWGCWEGTPFQDNDKSSKRDQWVCSMVFWREGTRKIKGTGNQQPMGLSNVPTCAHGPVNIAPNPGPQCQERSRTMDRILAPPPGLSPTAKMALLMTGC